MALNNLKVIALIPARLGSKGVKEKNIFPINEKPLIDFTIEAAKSSEFIDEIFVSSDSKKILERASYLNVNGIIRPSKYSMDNSTAVEVVNHFYKKIIKNGIFSESDDFYLVYLQPTSPLRDVKILDDSFRLMMSEEKTSLISLTINQYSPFKSFYIRDGYATSMFDEKITNKSRQDLETTYRANGAIYTFLISQFIKNKGIPSNGSIPFIMDSEDSIDIDTQEDIQKLLRILSDRK